MGNHITVQQALGLASPRVPLLLVGPPGIGKTALVHNKFESTSVMLASSMVEEDIGGIPFRDASDNEHRTEPEWLRIIREADAKGQTTCLFLDELDKARRAVADTLLTLITKTRANKPHHLPSKTCIIAAANPAESGGADGIGEVMLSRFCVVNVTADIFETCNYLASIFGSEPCLSIIDGIRNRTVDLIDQSGEGLALRHTNPRSIEQALYLIQSDVDHEVLYHALHGRVAPRMADFIMTIIKQRELPRYKKAIDAAFTRHQPIKASKNISKKSLAIQVGPMVGAADEPS